MKRIAPLFFILFLAGCTKERVADSIVGTWTLTEINTNNTSSVQLSRTQFSVEFTKKDSLIILGPKTNYSFLRDFNHYEILSDGRIKFSNTNIQDEMFAAFDLCQTLSISYSVRCPYQEKFIRR